MENQGLFRIANRGLGVYFAIWIVLEGNLWQTVLLAIWMVGLGAMWVIDRWQKQDSVVGWGVIGGVAGTLAAPLTLFLMALKTGLHAHGAEFTPTEIAWIMEQIGLWAGVGFCLGLAMGFFRAGTK